MDKTEFVTTVSIKYGELSNYIDWCTSNCNDTWSVKIVNEAGYQPGEYMFKFNNSNDYTTFLVWKS
jgi:hypothetical protein